MTDKVVILTTCESAGEATRLARHLIELHLAACVNILPGVRSIYRWKEKVEDSAEVLLMIKTRRDILDRLKIEIGKMHSYEIPEMIALPIVDGSQAYLNWLDRELAK